MNHVRIAVLIAIFVAGGARWCDAADFTGQREAMVAEVKADFRAVGLSADTPSVEGVFKAMMQVPRHEFVPEDQERYSYENRPLPIGWGQTISQPFVVALMTDLLRLESDDVVFELGTGSGYQAAILAEQVREVYSMEIVPELAQQAIQTLDRLGYNNVRVKVGDGYYGWSDTRSFDAVIVTAAGDHIPPPLIRQLNPGGRMILPVGGRFLTQQLVLLEKRLDGSVTTREILPVRFVPLTGGH